MAHSQSLNSIVIDSTANGKEIQDYLIQIENDYQVDFIFDQHKLGNFSINGIKEPVRLMNYLNVFYQVLDIKIIEVNSKIALLLPNDLIKGVDPKNGFIAIKSNTSSKVNLSGEIFDIDSNDPLVGAQVTILPDNIGGVTDINGGYSISYPITKPYHLLLTKYIGYDSHLQLVAYSKYGNGKMPRTMIYPTSTKLEDVIVHGYSVDRNVSENITGVENMGIESIKTLPTFMGEVDPIKGLTTLPGVSTVGELSAGFNVRGGNLGQNLIRQDGATIYNPSHLFGYYSAFNSDLVDNVTLIKGGGNAKYGSRVSSIMDVSLRNGETRDFHVNGGIGIISSRLSVEGPLIKNRSSFIVGGRISYADWILKRSNDIKLSQSSVDFGDLTAKLFQMINENNFISVSAYGSFDSFSLASDSLFTWGNKAMSFKWGHNFNSTANSQFIFSTSTYHSQLENKDELVGFKYQNGVSGYNLNYNVEKKFTEAKQMNFGLEANYSIINPGESKNTVERSNILEFDIDDHKTLETSIFAQYDWDLTGQFAISAGIRYSQFYRFGKGLVYEFNYNLTDSQFPERVDSIFYDTNELIDFQHGLEPRISLRYKLNVNTSIKASYNRTFQYIHLISNTTSSSPIDYWLSGGPNLKPEIGDQFSLGVFKNFSDNSYEVSAEGYYKHIQNTIDYIEGAEVKLTEAIEGSLIQGDGFSYGIEVLAKKNTGNWNGWLSYTYSRSLLQFNSPYDILTINDGELYPSQYDQPHNLSIVMNCKVNKILSISANFSYATGRPITIPVSKFSYSSYPTVLNYSQRNEFRVPDYHRLDLSATLKGEHPNKRFQGEWVLSIFNVYGRNNVYAVLFDEYGGASKVSIVGSMFPSLSYNFKF
ncbi:TonB-dependent receptor [Reichenbachiella ulvae]|uniref:TonB-dependent receptor n=1 Tax=Reichenbachiella ulvae TaxID=2980104 RepID=A0ABT3CYF9_9BACT|nr:TonB-dependent receptor [Reichenbachiella ulvae]MCV9388657.1 TonB-dependent receptor [Reichenbachiella ulvae]